MNQDKRKWLDGEGVPALSPKQATDYLAIEQILNRFCHAIDAGDSSAFAALFANDGKLVMDSAPDAGEIAGRAALVNWHRQHHQQQEQAGHFYRHQVLVPVINLSGDLAEILAYLTTDGMRYEDKRIHIQMGRYEAACIRLAEGWKIAALREYLFFGFRANEHQYHQNGRESLARAKAEAS